MPPSGRDADCTLGKKLNPKEKQGIGSEGSQPSGSIFKNASRRIYMRTANEIKNHRKNHHANQGKQQDKKPHLLLMERQTAFPVRSSDS
jgi:hypothetical protein